MITFYRHPETISTPYSPVYFDCSSDEATITTVIADVYVNNILVSTIEKEPKLGTTDEFRFEVGEILKKHFTLDLDTSITSIALEGAGGSALYYQVKTFEVLDNGTTLDTSWSEDGAGTNNYDSSVSYAFDGVIHYGQDLNDYIATSATDKFLTNRPFWVNQNNDFVKSALVSGIPIQIGVLTENSSKVEYKCYDSSFNVLSSNSTSIVAPVNKKLIFKHTGEFDAGTKYFSIQLVEHPSIDKTYLHVYKVVEPCDNKIIYWKNQYGGYDYYHFEGNYRKSASSNSDSYEKRLEFGYASTDRGEAIRKVENKEEFTVYTKTENKYIIDWLHEILQSSDVYLYDGSLTITKRYIPIIITGGSSQSINEENPVTQFSLTYQLANKKYSQIG